eukprot:m.126433 g.126433  ORF g.126433 m.126433 type:complete len:57 (-) comp16681_c0_seq1:376-546(-)
MFELEFEQHNHCLFLLDACFLCLFWVGSALGLFCGRICGLYFGGGRYFPWQVEELF